MQLLDLLGELADLLAHLVHLGVHTRSHRMLGLFAVLLRLLALPSLLQFAMEVPGDLLDSLRGLVQSRGAQMLDSLHDMAKALALGTLEARWRLLLWRAGLLFRMRLLFLLLNRHTWLLLHRRAWFFRGMRTRFLVASMLAFVEVLLEFFGLGGQPSGLIEAASSLRLPRALHQLHQLFLGLSPAFLLRIAPARKRKTGNDDGDGLHGGVGTPLGAVVINQ